MKPEHFCSGNFGHLNAARIDRRSFNEAGAFLLRKRVVAMTECAPSSCFNEAGAFLLRKHAQAGRCGKSQAAASMKPEHFCSGTPPTS